jgi:hypothetical protein
MTNCCSCEDQIRVSHSPKWWCQSLLITMVTILLVLVVCASGWTIRPKNSELRSFQELQETKSSLMKMAQLEVSSREILGLLKMEHRRTRTLQELKLEQSRLYLLKDAGVPWLKDWSRSSNSPKTLYLYSTTELDWKKFGRLTRTIPTSNQVLSSTPLDGQSRVMSMPVVFSTTWSLT